MSLVRAEVNVADKYIGDSYPFRFKSNRSSIRKHTPISKLKQSSMSRSWVRSKLKVNNKSYIQSNNILSSDIHFVFCQATLLFLRYSYLKIWPWKIQSQFYEWNQYSRSHNGSNTLSTHIPFVPCQPALVFLRHGSLKNWLYKLKVKAMSEVNV